MFVDRRQTNCHWPEGRPEEPEESETDLSAEGNDIVFGECAAVDYVDTSERKPATTGN